MDNVAECRKRLIVLSKTVAWAADALQRIDDVSPTLLNVSWKFYLRVYVLISSFWFVQEWFYLTRLAALEPLENMLQAEVISHSKVFKNLGSSVGQLN